MSMEHISLNLVYRDSFAYQQGRKDALEGRACRYDDDNFAGYFLSYLAGYREAIN